MNKQELEKIKQKALEEHIPIIMDDTLEVVDKILKEVKPKRILEIGTAVGYSAMCFSEFLAENGEIDTIERDEERIQEAKENFKNVGVENKINLYEGDAVEILPTLNEKYEHSRIMNHDFREHLNVLKTLISEDIQKAQEYVGKIEKECEDSKIEKYSDNNILNILLIRKKKECEENGIKLNITSTNPKLDFIDGMDTVAIFSNLINNAIEACSSSARRDIFIDLYTVNNAFSVIKVEHYADKEPIVVEGMLRSGKDDGNSHGIGIKSINNSLSKYDGKMSWSYDKAKGMFRTVISINNSQINI